MEMPAALYVVGDVHGMMEPLRALERLIEADASTISGRKLIVMLGDYIDRGPKSARVLDHLLTSPPPGFDRICLAGNHEETMLAFIGNPSSNAWWLDFGGRETLMSYGIDMADLPRGKAFAQLLASSIPPEHIAFMRELPAMLCLPGLVLVHAGVRAGVPLEAQDERDLLWLEGADETAVDENCGYTVVHGHTIVKDVSLSSRRISVDTGAYATGRLTAIRIVPGEDMRLLTSTS